MINCIQKLNSIIRYLTERLKAIAFDMNARQPLKNFLIFYRFDKIGETVERKQTILQCLKFYFAMFSQLYFVTQNLIIYFADDNNPIKKFVNRLDIVKYIAEKSHLVNWVCILFWSFSSMILYIFNHSNSAHYYWFDIIKMIDNRELCQQLFTDSQFCDKLIIKVKNFKNLLTLSLYFAILCCCFVVIFVIIVFFDLRLVHIWLTTLVTCCLNDFFALSIFYFSFFYYFIVCQYVKMRVSELNNSIRAYSPRKLFMSHKCIKSYLDQHDKISKDIDRYDKFWNRYLFVIHYCLTPLNLIILHMTLFEQMQAMLRILFSSFLVISTFANLIFNLFTASINQEFNNSYKIMQKFSVKSNSVLTVNRRMQLINAMERCSDRRRLIGFSCGHQFVITRDIAFKTFIIFLRFFLLTHKLAKF